MNNLNNNEHAQIEELRKLFRTLEQELLQEMNNPPEIQEQLKAARAVLDAVERGEEIEVKRDKGPSGITWWTEPALGFLNFLSYYRVKPKPKLVPYTVFELLEQGIHYVLAGGDIWTVRAMNTARNTLTVDTFYHKVSPVEHEPEWFAYRNFLWSADGKNWNNFRKEKQ